MAKQFKVLVNTGNAQSNQSLDVTQGQGAKGQPLRIAAKAGAKYQLQELDKNKEAAPEYVKVKRVGKNLHILLENSTEADIIIEDYYEVMPEGYNGVVGQAENGNFYEYIPEDPDVKGLIPQLADGGQTVSVALGGAEVVGSGAAVGVLAFNPLLAALGLAGAGAAAAAAGGTTATTSNTTIGSVTDNAGNPGNGTEALANGASTNDKTPTLTGQAPAGTVITIKDGGVVIGSATADANGNWSFTPPADLAEGKHSFTAESTTNGVANVSPAFEITVDTIAPQIAITTDKIALGSAETAAITFTLSEASADFVAGDITTTGGTLSALLKSAANPLVYTATFTPTAGATSAKISVGSNQLSDAAGNANQDGADANNSVALSLGSAQAKAAVALDPLSGDNLISAAEGAQASLTLTGRVSGAFTPGDIVTIRVGTQTYTTIVAANGSYSQVVPMTELKADADKKVEVSVAVKDPATGQVSTVDNSQTYTVEGAAGTSTNGFVIEDTTVIEWSGYSVSSAGDFNGDGLSDLFVSAHMGTTAYGGSYAGKDFVVFGKTSGTTIKLTALTSGSSTDGFVINGGAAGQERAGFSLSNAGDINGDGYSDLLIGAPSISVGVTNSNGLGYVVFGRPNSTAPIELSAIANGTATNGFAMKGTTNNDNAGYSISNAGDVNGDGLADLIMGVRWSDPNSLTDAGRSFVVFGKTSTTAINLSSLQAGASTDGFEILGQAANDFSGSSVSGIGDVNGDGLADIVVGAYANDANGTDSGRSYVVFGKTGSASVALSGIAAGTGSSGFVINGQAASDQSGFAVSYAGDINGDGLSDLIIGAPSSIASNTGRTYVVFGKTDSAGINLLDVAAGSNGFVINGKSAGDLNGGAVSYAGDLNGDGYDDLVVGANQNYPSTYGGKTYVIYGGSQFISGNVALATGSTADEYVVGTSGADTLVGNGGVDRFNAGKGNDTIVLQTSDVSNLANNVVGSVKAMVDGGTGFDTLQVSAAGVNLDMTTISNVGAMANEGASRINSIERINLGADATANTLTLTAKDVNDMADFNSIRIGSVSDDGKTWTNVGAGTALSATTKFHQVVVEGTVADTLNLGAGFTQVGTVNNGTATYNVYQNTATNSQVIVDSAITNVVMDLPPTLVSTSPADNAQVAATNLTTDLTLTFNEAVKAGTGVIELYNASTNVLVESFNVASSTKLTGWNSNTLTINPTTDLSAGTGYYVKVAATAVKDLGDNAYAGITDATTFNFLTLNSDGSIPVVPPYGGATGSKLGWSVSSAGDVNGDGYDDVIVGTNWDFNVHTSPTTYVVYGSSSGTGVSLVNGTIAPSLGFAISSGQNIGYSVSSAGDVNGDGFADLLVGGWPPSTGGGTAYVIYGKAQSPVGVMNLDAGIAASNGFNILTPSGQASLANSVSAAGDVNGDGLADFIIGQTSQSKAFVLYGTTSLPTSNTLSIDNAIASSSGFVISGLDGIGYSVSSAGDVNGDGLGDLILGENNTSSGGGGAYVVYGNSTGTAVSMTSGTIAATQGFRLAGVIGDSTYGFSVSSAGDVNGDGLADLIVGRGKNRAETYVVYGNSSGTGLQLGAVIPASQGFKINGQVNSFGWSVSNAGDINGDGMADLIVGDGGNNATYIVYGASTNLGVDISTGTIAANQGFKLVGPAGTAFGGAVASAGDINGDGLGDLIMGAPSTNSNAGAYYLTLGGTQNVTSAINLTGTASDEAVLGTAGNDVLVGNGGVDRFFAGKGNDTIVLQGSDATNLASNTGTTRTTVQGGQGFDTLRLSAGMSLDMTAISNVGAMGLEENSRIESIERIDMATDTSANTLTLTAKDVNDMADFNSIRIDSVSDDGKTWTNVTGTALSATTKFHQVVVEGTAADALTLEVGAGAWANVGEVNYAGGPGYFVYQNTETNSQVIVDKSVVVNNKDKAPPVVVLTDAINGEADSAAGLVTNVGDVNGDGYDDILIGAGGKFLTPGGLYAEGRSYLVFGGSNNLMPTNLSALTVAGNSLGFVINGASGFNAGSDVSAAGDLNGDGLADLFVGASGYPSSDHTSTIYWGLAAVVYGKKTTTAVNIDSLGTNGFYVAGTANWNSVGADISNAGDVNGDGLNDLIVGALGRNLTPNGSIGSTYAGGSYVVFGQANNANITIDSIEGGYGGFMIKPNANYAGSEVTGAGDVNGDGLADVVMNSGNSAYVVFGKSTTSAVDLAVGLGTSGYAITGLGSDSFANAFTGVGDVNGDGLADLFISASSTTIGSTTGVGRGYVVFGKTSNSTISMSSFTSGASTNGFMINGENSVNASAGYAVSGAGDFNGDGLADLLISSTQNSTIIGGRMYIVYGKTGSSTVELSDVKMGMGGFAVTGQSTGDQLNRISNAGDVNGDGFDDLIVSAPGADPLINGSTLANAGKTYIIYGGSQFISGNVALATGTSADEYVVGTSGNDTLTGNGGVDRFNAGKGDDTIVLQTSDVTNLASNVVGSVKAMVDGGTGFDTLQVSASGVNLDLTPISNVDAMMTEGTSRINSIERINLGADTTANALTLAAKDVTDLAGFNSIHTGTASADGNAWINITGTALSDTTKFHQVVVEGTAQDTLNLQAGNGYWSIAGEVRKGTTNYDVYQNTAMKSQVIVDKNVVVNNNDGPIGQTVIDLNTSGKLIAPVQVEGKWYYYWDRSGDGTKANTGSLNGGTDVAKHDVLDAIFKYDINGVENTTVTNQDGFYGTTDVYRYATINGVQLALPTANGGIPFTPGIFQTGTAATGQGVTNNSIYDDLLAVWDAFNGATATVGNKGTPTGWSTDTFMWSSTPSSYGHFGIYLETSGDANQFDSNGNYNSVLQVVAANTAPVLDAAQSPTLTSVSAGAAAPVNGNTTAGDLVSTLVGGITDADGAGVAKGIAITGVRAGATLYYSTNGGTTWLTATGVSETNALLLAADSNTRVFYKTTTAGSVTDAFTFRAWDVTANITEGVYTDTTPRGGKAQFSLTSDTVGIAVTAPVVLDLNRDGMLSYGQVTMDVNGDGLMDLTRWAGAQDGVLVWDKFADGLVYNNSQYAFGQYATTYRMDALGFARTATDLEGLADAFDTNQDGKFNAADAKFAQFSVWQDANQDGISGVGEVRSLADLGVTEINLVSDGVVRTPEDGVFEAGQSTATLADGTSMLIADVAFAYATASSLSSAKLAADASVAGDATLAESTTAELLPADIVTEFNNKPYLLSDEELAALNPLGQTAQAEDANVIEVTLNEAQLIDEAFFVGARPLVEPALVESTNVDITPEDVAAAIAVCTGAAESSTYSLSFGQSLDLTTVLKDMSFNGIVKGLEQVDMATDTSANKVSLTLADVLSLPPTNGVHQLMLTGAANDKLMLTEGEWTDTGNVVNQNGNNYAVYTGTTDPSAQLLIDQHMLQSHQTS